MEFLKKYRILLIFAFLAVMLIILFTYFRKKKKQTETETETEMEAENSTETMRANTLHTMLVDVLEANDYETKLAKMIVAQSIHETGHFKSSLFLNYNNPWGMMHPAKRDTTSIGANPKGFAMYNNLEDAVKDYVLYLNALDYKKDYSNVREFVSELKRKGYFTDTLTNYMSSVYSIYNKLNLQV